MDTHELLTRGVAEILVESEFKAKLASGRRLRLKQGFDPTKPDMHIGHAVGLRKLRKFQELGHQVVLIVGDWTAQIGDPSGRDETRPRLDAATVRSNAETYMEQFFKVVDRSQTEIRWQSEWFNSFSLEQALSLAGRFTLAHMLSHETFRKRYDEGSPVSILELMYPMLQGYDSVAVNPDVEFGGTDQKFNNLAGRELMGQVGMVPQDILLVPLIPGTDGRKMGKSFNNTIDILMTPFEMFSKVMSMSDDVLPLYFEVLSDIPLSDLAEIKQSLMAGSINPMELKKQLGREVVAQFHSPADASASEAEWVRRFSKRELPSEIEDFEIDGPINIIQFITASGMASSNSEARRAIAGGGVYIIPGGNEEHKTKVTSIEQLIDPEQSPIVQLGKRQFRRAKKKQ